MNSNNSMKKESTKGDGSKPNAAAFSPTNSSQMSNFFNSRGPIRPQSLVQDGSSSQAQVPSAISFIRGQDHSSLIDQQRSGMQRYGGGNDESEEEEDDIYGTEEMEMHARQLQVLEELQTGAGPQFERVIKILRMDPELTPLILEHQLMLRTLKDIEQLKAEQMLSILTAAEQEMYENSRNRDDQQQMKEQVEQANKNVQVNLGATNSEELEKLKTLLLQKEKEVAEIAQNLKIERNQREEIEKEKEVTFTNLYEENKDLKRQNESLKQSESQSKREIERSKADLSSVISHLRDKLSQEESSKSQLKSDILKVEGSLRKAQELADKLEREVEVLQAQNEQLHRKVNSTYNSVLMQAQTNHQYLLLGVGNENNGESKMESPQKKDMSSFHISGFIEQHNQRSNAFANNHFRYQSRDIKVLANDVRNISGINSSSMIHSREQEHGIVRSNSVEVLLLDQPSQQKQNQFILGEEEKTSGIFGNRQSWVKTRTLFMNLSPIQSEESPKKKRKDEQLSQLQVEVSRLESENRDLSQKLKIEAEKVMKLSQKKEEESKGSMLIGRGQLGDTFSKSRYEGEAGSSNFNERREETDKVLQEYYDKVSLEFRQKLAEIGNRLLNLFKKSQAAPTELLQFQHQEFSIGLLKDLIYEIQNKVEGLAEGHKPVQSSTHPLQNQFFQNFSPNVSSPGDQSSFELKNLLIEEKERRLGLQEELHKTQKDILRLQGENDRLKQELHGERVQSQTIMLSQLEQKEKNQDYFGRQNFVLSGKVESLQDENISLKLKVTDLESELFEFRKGIEVRHDHQFYALKSDIEGQFSEYKQRMENQQMQLKEDNHRLKVEMQGVMERNLLLKEHLAQFRQRIQELEKENLSQCKENYLLQNELDYENLKVAQLQGVNQKNNVDWRAKQAEEVNLEMAKKYEFEIKELNFRLSENELALRKASELHKLKIGEAEEENFKLRNKVKDLEDELKIFKNQSKFVKAPHQSSQHKTTTSLKDNKQVPYILSLLSGNRERFQKLRAFHKLVNNSIKSSKAPSVQEPVNEDEKVAQLEEQLTKWQQNSISLCTQLGKALKQLSAKNNIKLNLAGLVPKAGLSDILSGMKNNKYVTELNLNSCELDDEDLFRLCDVLRNDQKIASLKIGMNQFTNQEALLEIVRMKQVDWKQIDLSGFEFDGQGLTLLGNLLKGARVLEVLVLQGIVRKINGVSFESLKMLVDSIVRVTNLKIIDLSKNKIKQEVLDYFLVKIKTNQSIESVNLNNVGLISQNFQALHQMVKSQTFLKQLSLSHNKFQSSQLQMLCQSLMNCKHIQDLDLSMSEFNSNEAVFKELGKLIQENKSLKTLVLQKCKISDSDGYHLMTGLAAAPHLEIIKLDWNNLTGVFVEKLVQKIQANFNPVSGIRESPDIDSDCSIISNQLFGSPEAMQKRRQQQNQDSWVFISLEGNQIGDKGAASLARLIESHVTLTKSLRKINLNECAISNYGFEQLRQALVQRANQAQVHNLTHIRVSIERNNIY